MDVKQFLDTVKSEELILDILKNNIKIKSINGCYILYKKETKHMLKIFDFFKKRKDILLKEKHKEYFDEEIDKISSYLKIEIFDLIIFLDSKKYYLNYKSLFTNKGLLNYLLTTNIISKEFLLNNFQKIYNNQIKINLNDYSKEKEIFLNKINKREEDLLENLKLLSEINKKLNDICSFSENIKTIEKEITKLRLNKFLINSNYKKISLIDLKNYKVRFKNKKEN